jgi:hypothetical protein
MASRLSRISPTWGPRSSRRRRGRCTCRSSRPQARSTWSGSDAENK